MSFPYGAPPPPPPAAASGYQYGQSYQHAPSQRGNYGGGRGRGGHQGHAADRAAYQQPHAYPYGQQQPQPYPQQAPAPYPVTSAHAAYAVQQQGQWHAAHHQQAPAATPLSAQNYHPNYAPQMYQQQHHQQPVFSPQSYSSAQPGYGPAAYPASASAPQAAPSAQQWGSHPQQHQDAPNTGRGRGGYNDRSAETNMMGPPIRMGFDSPTTSGHTAPVSNPYPQPQPFGTPRGPPGPFPPPPFPGFSVPQLVAPHAGGQTQHDRRGRQNGQRGVFRGGHRGSNHFNKSRGNFQGGDKMRNRDNRTGSHPHQKPDGAAAGKKKKHKKNLNLFWNDSEEEDDDGEEERLYASIGQDVPNPRTSDEVEEWLTDRRANFPHKARVEAKKAKEKQQAKQAKNDEDELADKLREEIRAKEAQLAEHERMKRKRITTDEGDELRDLESQSDDTLDDKPETMSTKPEDLHVPPPPKKADQTKQCKYFSTGANCAKQTKCRFVHDAAVRRAALEARALNGGRMTLQQRLTLNDKHQEDLTIVQSLKYLQDKGLKWSKGLAATGSAESNGQPTSSAQPAKEENKAPSLGLHHPPPHGLPQRPPV